MKTKTKTTRHICFVLSAFFCGSLIFLLFSLEPSAFSLFLTGFAALSGLITVMLIVACALDSRLTATDRKAQDDFFHNPFRQDLTFRTFPHIIVQDRPKADLVIVHKMPVRLAP